MKIERFNEKLDRGISEPWTEDKFQKIYNINREITDNLLPLLTKYLILNKDVIENEIKDLRYEISSSCDAIDYDYFKGKGKYMWFKITFSLYKNGEGTNWYLDRNQFEDLLNFLENPDTYESTKKYNL